MEKIEHGLIDNWLQHIKDVERFHHDELENYSGEEKIDRLCELNVMEQVANVCNTTVLKEARAAGNTLTVHGWIYDIKNGILKDLKEP